MVLDQAKGAIGQKAGAYVQVSSIAGSEGQRMLREAVLGDMRVGGREDGALGSVEGAGRRRVVVGMVAAESAGRALRCCPALLSQDQACECSRGCHCLW